MIPSDPSRHDSGTTEDVTPRDLGLWRRPRRPSARLSSSSKTTNRAFGPSLLPSALQQVTHNAQGHLRHCASKEFWARKALRPLVINSDNCNLSTSLDSAYGSANASPADLQAGKENHCPTIPRFSWQTVSTFTFDPKSRTKPRHVEIVIPSWVDPLKKLPDTPTSIRLDLSDFPLPPTIPPKFATSPTKAARVKTVILAQEPPPVPPKFRLVVQGVEKSNNTMMDALPSGHRPLQMKDQRAKPFPSIQTSRPPISRSTSYASELDSPDSVSEASASGMLPALKSNTESPIAGVTEQTSSMSSNLSGLACNIHRTTGTEPPGLVGASTTIVGDKLYVFGGRRLSSRMPQLTRSLYELDLIRRHWTKLETRGSAPIPRYFHSICALGETKLVCYGGMAQLPDPIQHNGGVSNADAAMTVMSDIHIYDIPSQTWTSITTTESPHARYAHCAAILPSSSVFTSASAPLSAIHHNQATNRASSVTIDGQGGAEMIIVGGQDSASRYIEQISVFNLRSLRWTTSTPLSRSCGAYRSVAIPLLGMAASQLGATQQQAHRSMQESFTSDSSAAASEDEADSDSDPNPPLSGAPMLLYSNYNFLDVKLELQVRLPNGKLVEKPLPATHSPPGLRFPNAGLLANHLLVSGTFLTSTKQEYALWALDLRTLTWSRVDAGGGVFASGSWNRGVLWSRRNTYVVLGNRRRSLGEDYNHRRVNFSHLCLVELEAFGLYEDAERGARFQTVSAASQKLGAGLLAGAALADMDILALDGTRIPINTHILSHRWGPYFTRLLFESSDSPHTQRRRDSGSETSTLRPPRVTSLSNRDTLTPKGMRSGASSVRSPSTIALPTPAYPTHPRPRLLYLPHTPATIHALLHYLATSTVPPTVTSQTLCSLLQLARPYQVRGLLEAVVGRLHETLDGRCTAAVFNAAALAAGGGGGVVFVGDDVDGSGARGSIACGSSTWTEGLGGEGTDVSESDASDAEGARNAARGGWGGSGRNGGSEEEDKVWNGVVSGVVGLQKRGLRGLMEGRRSRERGRSDVASVGGVVAVEG